MKIIKENYLFVILFIIIVLKDPFYKIFIVKDNYYTPLKCSILEDEYNKLLEFNQIDLIYDTHFVNSYVIYKDIYNFRDEITISGGINEDFKNNPVVYDNTLLGTISRVNNTSSIVSLVTNKDSKISVKINDSVGVLEYIDNELVVKNISNISDISIGDYIYTSGLGNIKANIFIGEVKGIKLDKKNIEKTIIVNYKLNIKDINYVTVIKEKK